MSKRIVVNVGLLETRVAVQEGNLLTELYLERHRNKSIVSGVYKGTVTNVLRLRRHRAGQGRVSLRG